MGEVVNLRLARKRAERGRKSAEAETNRAAFGRSKAVKAAAARERERAAALLEGHRLASDENDAGRHGEAERPSER